MSDARLQLIQGLIRDVPDFPKPGIVFKDITPLLADPRGFVTCLDLFAEAYAGRRVDAVVGIESRGFIFGGALSARLNVPFVPARKPGKLPAETDRVEYDLEYGTDALEMHVDALASGWQVVIVDDLLATGGTAAATGELVERQGAEILGHAFVVELDFLGGRDKLRGQVESIVRVR
jgi:adenine phosphoribosyltransferase